MMYAYCRGLPRTPFVHFRGESHGVLAWSPCEDDVHVAVLSRRPELTWEGAAARERSYLAAIRRFPAAPETCCSATSAAGPGWALGGDAGHFKHPRTSSPSR